jgi:branched-chain amino acid transport system ATP-binding protein
VTALLEVTGLHTFYGASHVLHGVSFAIEPGQTVTLMGRNGMGKTTTIRSVLRLTPPRSGEVRIRGRPVTGWAPHRIAGEGIALVPEGRGIFPTLTVRENLVVAQRPGPWTEERALGLFPRLRERISHLGTQLSGGEQQMLAIARGLIMRPRVLMIDEMSQGLAPKIVQELFEIVRSLPAQGVAVLIVEQFVTHALAVASRAYVLEKGAVAYSGDAAALARDEAFVKGSYLGDAGGGEVGSNGSADLPLSRNGEMGLPAELLRTIEARAEAEGRNPADVVLELLTEAIGNSKGGTS